MFIHKFAASFGLKHRADVCLGIASFAGIDFVAGKLPSNSYTCKKDNGMGPVDMLEDE